MSQLVHVCRGNNTMKSCGVVHTNYTTKNMRISSFTCTTLFPKQTSWCGLQLSLQSNTLWTQQPKKTLRNAVLKGSASTRWCFDPSCCETLAKTKGTLKHVQFEPNDPKHHVEQPMETKMCLRGGVLAPLLHSWKRSKLIPANKRFCLSCRQTH
jgi:hypothetical protein